MNAVFSHLSMRARILVHFVSVSPRILIFRCSNISESFWVMLLLKFSSLWTISIGLSANLGFFFFCLFQPLHLVIPVSFLSKFKNDTINISLWTPNMWWALSTSKFKVGWTKNWVFRWGFSDVYVFRSPLGLSFTTEKNLLMSLLNRYKLGCWYIEAKWETEAKNLRTYVHFFFVLYPPFFVWYL